MSLGGEHFLRKDLGLEEITLYSRDGVEISEKFHSDRLHAAMILVSTNDEKSYKSIDKWKDIIRKQFVNEPIYLVLIDKFGEGN